MFTQVLAEYESLVRGIAGRYYWYYVKKGQQFDLDQSDLEQAARMAVWNVSQKRPDKLDNRAYVGAAIKYAVIGEMRRMRHRVPQTYLAHGYEEDVHIIDILPTDERGEQRADQLDDLLYHIRHEFSPAEADAVLALVDRCDAIYGLNLSEAPSTETKDRIRVVTKMDLNDEDILLYGQVLLGAREGFPRGYLTTTAAGANIRYRKLLGSLLTALGMTPRELARCRDKRSLLAKYRLMPIYRTGAQMVRVTDLIRSLDPTITGGEVKRDRIIISPNYSPAVPHLPNAGYAAVYPAGGPGHESFTSLDKTTVFVHLAGFPFLWGIDKILALAPGVKTIEIQPAFAEGMSRQITERCSARGVQVVYGYERQNNRWKESAPRYPSYDSQRAFLLGLAGEQKEKFGQLLHLRIAAGLLAARYFCLAGEPYLPQPKVGQLLGVGHNASYISQQINAVLLYLGYGHPDFDPSEGTRQIVGRILRTVRRRICESDAEAERRQRFSQALRVPLIDRMLPNDRLATYEALVKARDRGDLDRLRTTHPKAWQVVTLRFGLDTPSVGVYRRRREVAGLVAGISTRERVRQLENLGLSLLGIRHR